MDRYTRELIAELDLKAKFDFATNKGIRMGLEKGLKEGYAEGKSEIALKMKSMGLPAETIAEATGLSAEEIEKL